MPVHSREKKEINHEEMEVDFPEQDGSSTDEEDTVSSSVSEDGDSSGRKNNPLISTHRKFQLIAICAYSSKLRDILCREGEYMA